MLSSRRLQMVPHGGSMLDIQFGTTGALVLHHHEIVTLEFLAASDRWSIFNTGNSIQLYFKSNSKI